MSNNASYIFRRKNVKKLLHLHSLRFMSILLCFAFSAMILFPAAAISDESVGYSLKSVTPDYVALMNRENLLRDATANYGGFGVGFNGSEQGSHSTAQLFDGKASIDIYNAAGDTALFLDWRSSQNKNPPEALFSFKFSGNEIIDRILLYYSAENTKGNSNASFYGVDSYEVYILKSDDNGSLFDEDNKLDKFELKDKTASGDLIVLENPLSVKQIGFKFPTGHGVFKAVYLMELGVYASNEINATSVNSDYVEENHENNLLRDATANYGGYGVGFNQPEQGAHSENQLTDGKAKIDAYNTVGDTAMFTDWRSSQNKNPPQARFSFTFDQPKYLQSLLVYYSAYNTNNSSSFKGVDSCTVYVLKSDEDTELFNENNQIGVLKFKNNTAEGLLVEFEELSEVKEIGFEFPTGTESDAVFLMELAAYGPSADTPITSEMSAEEVAAKHNLNLLKDAVKDFNKWGVGYVETNQGSHSTAQMFDGKAETDIYNKPGDTAAFFGWSGTAPNFVFSFSEIKRIESILLFYGAGNSRTSYEIYLSVEDDKSTLFDDVNRIGEYKISSSIKKGQLVSFAEAREAKLIGIKFPQGNTNSPIYLMEIAAYAPIADSITATDVIGLKDQNRISEITLDSNSYILYSDGGTYNRTLEKLYDGYTEKTEYRNDADGDGVLLVGTDGSSVRLTLKLNHLSLVNKVLIAHTATAPVLGIKIYASGEKENLFSSEPVMIAQNGNKNSANLLYSLETPTEAEYIGLEFTTLNDVEGIKGICLTELGVYGRAMSIYSPKLTMDSVDGVWVSDKSAENLIKYSTPAITNDWGKAIKADNTAYIRDGMVGDGLHFTYWRASTGEDPTLRFTYNIGQTVPIDTIMFMSYYSPSLNLLTNEYEVYVGNDLDTLYNDENLVIYYNNEGKFTPGESESKPGSVQLFEFEGEMPVGKYIGFRIIDPCVFDDAIRIEEIGIYSKGNFPADPVYAQSFVDEQSQINVKIRKLDYEDEFKLVNSIKINRSLDKSEMVNAASNYYLESCSDIYTVQLFDAAGNIITDEMLDGRKVEIYMPFEMPEDGSQVYACVYKDGKLENLEGFAFDNKIRISFEEQQTFGLFKSTFIQGVNFGNTFDWDPIYELSYLKYKNDGLGDVDDDSLNKPDNIVQGELDENEEEVENVNKRKLVKKKVTVSTESESEGNPIYIYIIAGIGAVIISAAAVTTIILIRKKRSKL